MLEELYHVFILLVGVILFWWALWTVFDLAANGKFKKYFLEVKLMSGIENLENHYVICEASRIGLHVTKLLAAQKERFVPVDQHDVDVDAAKKHGFPVMEGEPFNEAVLLDAGLKKARTVSQSFVKQRRTSLLQYGPKSLTPFGKNICKDIEGRASKCTEKAWRRPRHNA